MRFLKYFLLLLLPLIVFADLPSRLRNVVVSGYLYPNTSGVSLGSSTATWSGHFGNLFHYGQPAGALYIGSGSSVASLPSITATELTSLDGIESNIQAQINAAISGSLSSTLATGKIYIGNGSSVATAQTVSGDATLSQTGDLQIASGAIVNADINASAAIADTKLDTIATAGKVSNSATTATSANTASAIVARDASGDFSAGTITANLTGTASGNPPNSRAINTSAPLSGGGDLSGDRTLSIPAGSSTADGYITDDAFHFFAQKVNPSRAVNTSSPLSGGGALSSDLTLSISAGSSTANGYIDSGAYHYFSQKVNPSRAVNTTSPLGGGGTLVGDLTLTVDDGSSTAKGVLTTSAQNIGGEKTFHSPILLKEIATPSNPSAGFHKFYMKSDGGFYRLSSGGVETEIGTGGGGGGTQYAASLYHEQNCAWSRANTAYGNPDSVDSSCTFGEYENKNMGSTASYNDGTPGNNYPGFTVTLPIAGMWYVCGHVIIASASGGAASIELNTTGGTSIAQAKGDTAGKDTTSICGVYEGTAASTTFRMQFRATSGDSASIGSSTGATPTTTVEWSIFFIGS